AFTIAGSELKTAAGLNFEAKSSYAVVIRSTDAAGLFVEREFTISVTNVNEVPSGIALSGNSVVENAAVGTVVGTLSTTDPDAGDTFTYTLVGGDVAAFTITGTQLRTEAGFDFEAKASYTVAIRSTDAAGLFVDREFTISVTNVNEASTSINLSNNSVAENAAVGTVVGTLSTTDPDAGDTFTYSLVGNAADNAAFTVAGNQLKTAAGFNFEAKASYTVVIRSTDAAGLFIDREFTISVTNVNEAPTSIALSGSSVAENASVGTVVGVLSTTDQDAGDTFTYTLVGGDVAAFTIAGSELKTSAGFDFEAKASYTVVIRSTDAAGLFVEREFTVSVTNALRTLPSGRWWAYSPRPIRMRATRSRTAWWVG
ncbi:MAG: cadherin repeat domain-containing protein, partial [Proteobacteria bacterium]|nr:cadherin repeat domain-containing protein [Pseudomonadota bacterium]